jgi:hypothetical protein
MVTYLGVVEVINAFVLKREAEKRDGLESCLHAWRLVTCCRSSVGNFSLMGWGIFNLLLQHNIQQLPDLYIYTHHSCYSDTNKSARGHTQLWRHSRRCTPQW